MRTNTNKENQGEGTPVTHILGTFETDKRFPWYIRRGELLEKVKAQCVARGGSASQVALQFKSFAISPVDQLPGDSAPSFLIMPTQILVLPLDLCNYSEHKAAFDKVKCQQYS